MRRLPENFKGFLQNSEISLEETSKTRKIGAMQLHKSCCLASKTHKGMTLVELLVVVTILGILVAVMVPEVTSAIRENKARATSDALRMIESAKSKWQHEYPGSNPESIAQLSKYFPGGLYPKDPWKIADGFKHELCVSDHHASCQYSNEPEITASHVYNGETSKGDKEGDDILENGYNDVFQP